MGRINNQIVIEKATRLGFDLVGFAKVEILETEAERLNSGLTAGIMPQWNIWKKITESGKM